MLSSNTSGFSDIMQLVLRWKGYATITADNLGTGELSCAGLKDYIVIVY